jgi:hypothetical protein
VITPRLDRIYSAFERIVACDRSGYPFERRSDRDARDLPAEYRAFVSAPRRLLPSSWQLFSYFGHDSTTLESVNSELRAQGVSDEWLVFGMTAGEDFLVFDQRAGRKHAVVWCDADSTQTLERQVAYADSFSGFIARVAKHMAEEHLRTAREVLQML